MAIGWTPRTNKSNAGLIPVLPDEEGITVSDTPRTKAGADVASELEGGGSCNSCSPVCVVLACIPKTVLKLVLSFDTPT